MKFQEHIRKLRVMMSAQASKIQDSTLEMFFNRRHALMETAAGQKLSPLPPVNEDIAFIAQQLDRHAGTSESTDVVRHLLDYYENKYEIDLRQHRLVRNRVEHPYTRSNSYRAPSNERASLPEIIERGGASETVSVRQLMR